MDKCRPLAEKGTRHSPYVYVDNNLIIFIDPYGRENVIVVGNQGRSPGSDTDLKNKYPKDSRHFLQAGLKEAKRLKKKGTEGGEATTMVVYKGNYTDKQFRKYEKMAEKEGIGFVVANSSKEVANYVILIP